MFRDAWGWYMSRKTPLRIFIAAAVAILAIWAFQSVI
jgi:hypothetical protein